MSDRVRNAMGRLNELAPDDAVYVRARQGPREPAPGPEPKPRARVVAAVTAFAVFALAVGFAWHIFRASPDAGSSSPSTSPPNWVISVARMMARNNEDPNPTSGEWGLVNKAVAAPAVGLSSGAATEREYLVVLHGSFIAKDASVPSGADLPKGSVLTFTLDPRTHTVNDWGVGGDAAHVAGLQPLPLPWES
jgi:hypothetical protein